MTISSPPSIAVIEQAAQRGDVDALMQLAIVYLTGNLMPRDLSAARHNIRRAVEIGHVDGALMEVALTANGTGGPVDWGAARTLLEAAARNDHIAEAQRALVAAMALDSDGSPLGTFESVRMSQSPAVVRFPSLLTAAECAHIASAASDLLEPAFVLDPKDGRRIAHPVRTSHDGAFGPAREDLVIRAINLRLAAITDTQVEQGEPLTVLHYAPGQQYRPHVDTIAGASNQRIKTVLIYLNQGYEGGETRFEANGVTVAGRTGDAIMFDNVLPDGSPDMASRHAGLPVRRGAKWLATRWIRAKRLDPWNPATSA